jgi:hypothetical protein
LHSAESWAKAKGMKQRWFLISLLSLLSCAGTTAKACDYELKIVHLQQCRPIALLGNGSGTPSWSFVEEKGSTEKVMAHILCSCDATLQSPQANCASEQTQKVTFTKPTEDILKTCAAQSQLCQEPCQALYPSKNN